MQQMDTSYERGHEDDGFSNANTVKDILAIGERRIYQIHLIMKI